MSRIRLIAGELALELEPSVGGSIAAYTHAAQPLMRTTKPGYPDVLDAACFPLVPYSNRIRDGVFSFRGQELRLAPNLPPQRHPLHGVGWRAPWTAESVEGSRAVLSLDWPGGEWPWAFRAEQWFELDHQGLVATLIVENRSEATMPAGLGFHPYFPCPPGTVLDAPVTEVFPVDPDLFPTGREPAAGRYSLDQRRISGAGLDNGYGGWSGTATIRWPDGRGLRISGEPPARWFQVYAPVGEPVLCAEPVTHANGALNVPEDEAVALGLRLLEPEERLTLAARFDPLP